MIKKIAFIFSAIIILGTFITRSGIVSSVHSFTAENLGPLFLGFLTSLILFTVYWFFKRFDLLKSDKKIDSFSSREGGFLYNNLILLLMCFIVLWGTLFPIFSEAWNGEKIYVGASYFNQLNVPIGLVLLFLMGIGPLLSWRTTSKSKLLSNFKIPMAVSFFSGIVYSIFFGTIQLYPLVTCRGIAFTGTSISNEFRKSYNKSKKKDGSILSTFGSMMLNNRHKNGGYIVHIGITLLFVGFIGRAFEVEKEFNLSPGEEIYFANSKHPKEKLVRYHIHVSKPSMGAAFFIGDDAYHAEEQGSVFQWPAIDSIHCGMNAGIKPKFLYHVLGVIDE